MENKQKLFTMLFVMFYRFSILLGYYGITMASDSLGGNMYRNFALSSLIEVPGHVILPLMSNRYVKQIRLKQRQNKYYSD